MTDQLDLEDILNPKIPAHFLLKMTPGGDENEILLSDDEIDEEESEGVLDFDDILLEGEGDDVDSV